MRILPFGDGIVLGEGASGGFRAPLEQLLQNANISFEFVGRRTENSFEMAQPAHEGWSRATITYLREERLDPAMAFAPDVILLYAGAEDLRTLPDAGIAVARLAKLIQSIRLEKPDCAILCSQLIPSRDYQAEQKVKRYNTVLGALVESLSAKDKNIHRIKMHAKVKVDTLNEHGFPNEAGYREIAAAWFRPLDDICRRRNDNGRTDQQ